METFDAVHRPVFVDTGTDWGGKTSGNEIEHIICIFRWNGVSYQAIILKKADHFLMLTRPDDFNQALEKAILMLPGEKW